MTTEAAKPAPTAETAFRARIGHEYTGGDYDALFAQPMPATAAMCRRLRCDLVQNGATWVLRFTAAGMQQVTARHGLGDLALKSFCWLLCPTVPEFGQYTADNANRTAEYTVLTPPSVDSPQPRLTAMSATSRYDAWTRRPLSFTLTLPTDIPAGTALRLETSSGIPLKRVTAPDAGPVSIDLSDFGSGLYRLTRDKEIVEKWFADETRYPAADSAAVLVLPGPWLSHVLTSLLHDPGFAVPEHTATFAARTVIWRYHVLNAAPDETLSIVTAGGDTSSAEGAEGATDANAATEAAPFSRVDDPRLPQAQTFEARQATKLSRRPTQRYALRNGRSVRVSPLPLAGLSFSRSARATDGHLCSDIFVHL